MQDERDMTIDEVRAELQKYGVDPKSPKLIGSLLNKYAAAQARIAELQREQKLHQEVTSKNIDVVCGLYEDIETRDKRIVELEALAIETKSERDAWRDVIAVLCRDGGQYHIQHGTEKTKEHALARFYEVLNDLDASKAHVAELEAIVAKLPKTADGVAVDIFTDTPPLTLWVICKHGEVKGGVVVGWCAGAWEDGPSFILNWDDTHTDEWVECSECYSTREAAEAAKEKGATDGE